MSARKHIATLGIAAAIATGAALVPPANAPEAQARVNWGAIAWTYSGATGYGVNYPTQGAAIRAAKGRCGSTCGYIAFYNSCGAVAYKFMAGRTRVGTARGFPTRAAASAAARRKAGPGSHVRGWACTAR
ncbi:MAG: DUF4189 domain-containing protein [Gordonia sp. (in: high G+C Gram-positive bacteria)]|uniref:DUF4189 domain-containing protein n=1 Tax=Gordonia sp. (in: high G+C Gram-positive bacteria) TaxID=84139 RepID=UPI0039E6260D